MLEIDKLYIDGSLFKVVDNDAPVFSWSVLSYGKDLYQKSFRLDLFERGTSVLSLEPFWSAEKETKEQSIKYDGPPLGEGKSYMAMLVVTDNLGRTSKHYSRTFVNGRLTWDAEWIAVTEDRKEAVVEFRHEFDVEKDIKECVLFVCGIGYHRAYVNGQVVMGGVLAPSVSNYNKTCYYEVLDVDLRNLRHGRNEISVIVGEGWRRINTLQMGYTASFTGMPQLTAMMKLTFTDGSEEWIKTNDNWKWRFTPYVSCTIFGGSVYDERAFDTEDKDVLVVDPPGGIMRPDILEPINEQKTYRPKSIFCPEEGVYVIDFGQNIAGYCHIKLPAFMESGQEIVIRHAEELDENGNLYTAPLREAAQTDKFVSKGAIYEGQWFSPMFTYHGFRYVEVTGVEFLKKEDIYAVSIYNSIDKESFFTSGSPMLNQVHQNALMTERSNIHSLLTDCPQRDERMAWLNDATVRFQALPYCFNINRIFVKTIRDVINDQVDGMITCTAPFVYGQRPADPVCSSFLIAGLEHYMATGGTDILEEAYESFKAWEEYLLSRSDNYIVNYSYYGDWASPSYACMSEEFAVSKVTPGELMSTGYSYLNCKMLHEFALILDKEEDAEYFKEVMEKIKEAFVEKWFDKESCIVAAGSHASQAFPLWLGIIPEEYRQKVCDVLRNDLVQNNYQFTTGNLCTRYMLEVLTQYGYVDDAYEIMTKETYPSIGYMIQNEATTVWERFELKKNPGMNSHNHPMYGSVYYWFYAYILGIKPSEKAFDVVDIKPYFPSKLLSAHGEVETIKGKISVRWANRYGNIHLYVTVPFGVTANVYLKDDEVVTVNSGCHYFKI